jgi:EAL domain-containing protein (putative c-di-GMP-specific phosphodiesterase class I)
MTVSRYDSVFEAPDAAEFRLAFQPVVEVECSAVRIWQALVQDARGQSFEHLLGTRPLAERSALLRRRTLAVIRAAVDSGLLQTDAKLAVPLHAASGSADETATDLLQAAMAHGIPVPRLVAEISADECGHVGAAIALADACAARGIAVALDGFTAGPVGIKLLGGCRPVYLRLAPALVHNLRTSPSRVHMMASVLRLCRSMNVRVIAPEIRFAAEAAELYGEGIALMQGEWIAPARVVSLHPLAHAERVHAPRREPRPGIAGLVRAEVAATHRRLAHHIRTAPITIAPAAR